MPPDGANRIEQFTICSVYVFMQTVVSCIRLINMNVYRLSNKYYLSVKDVSEVICISDETKTHVSVVILEISTIRNSYSVTNIYFRLFK